MVLLLGMKRYPKYNKGTALDFLKLFLRQHVLTWGWKIVREWDVYVFRSVVVWLSYMEKLGISRTFGHPAKIQGTLNFHNYYVQWCLARQAPRLTTKLRYNKLFVIAKAIALRWFRWGRFHFAMISSLLREPILAK